MPPPVPWHDAGVELLSTRDFEGTRLRRSGVYAVCFAAAWCPATRRFVPKFVARKGTVPANFAIADITDLDDPLWDVFGIRITPSMAVFTDGAPVARWDGRRVIGLGSSDLGGMADTVLRLSRGPATSAASAVGR